MPNAFSDRETDAGMSYLHVRTSGRVSLADVEALHEQLRRPSTALPKFLSVVLAGTHYEAEARRHMVGLDREFSAAAAVVTNPIVRAVVNLMVRMQTPHSGPVRVFEDEASALAWLEQQAARPRAQS